MLNKSQGKDTALLNQIHEGMSVFDADNKNIGTVSDMYFGAVADEQQDYGSGPATASDQGDAGNGEESRIEGTAGLAAAIPIMPGLNNSIGGNIGGVIPAFTFQDSIPEGMRSRLMEEGFVQVKGAGLLGTASYITPSQIASINTQDDSLHLTVTRDQLTHLA